MPGRRKEYVKIKRKRRRARLRQQASKIKISTKPFVARTIRKNVRRKMRNSVSSNLEARPWIQERNYKSNLAAKPRPASLLGLPTELRQHILVLTIVNDIHHMSRTEIGEWIGALCCVSPVIRLDIEWVSRVLKQLKAASEKSKKPVTGYWGPNLRQTLQDKNRKLPPKKPKKLIKKRRGYKADKDVYYDKGEQYVVHEEKYKTRRRPKCWRCLERHVGESPVCPPSIRDPEKWLQGNYG